MKRLVLALVCVILVGNGSVAAHSARSSILIDGVNGRVLWENNAYERLGMASTTKIMTAIVALENSNLEDIVVASEKAVGTEGSSIYLQVGERIAMESLLYGLLLHSGNDAATAIAEHISGSVAEFANLMNTTLVSMGIRNTNFTNPHGLHDENHYTTAFDLAQITRWGMRNSVFARMVGTSKKTIPREGHQWGRALTNHNRLLREYDGATGVKTGFTRDTGRTLVSAATRGGLPLIAVTLNAPDDWNDHREMLDYGFANYSLHLLAADGQYFRTFRIGREYIGIIADEGVWVALRASEAEAVQIEIDMPDEVERDVRHGDVVGEVRAVLYGSVMARANLVIRRHGNGIGEERIERRSFAEIYGRLWRGITTFRRKDDFGGRCCC